MIEMRDYSVRSVFIWLQRAEAKIFYKQIFRCFIEIIFIPNGPIRLI